MTNHGPPLDPAKDHYTLRQIIWESKEASTCVMTPLLSFYHFSPWGSLSSWRGLLAGVLQRLMNKPGLAAFSHKPSSAWPGARLNSVYSVLCSDPSRDYEALLGLTIASTGFSWGGSWAACGISAAASDSGSDLT